MNEVTWEAHTRWAEHFDSRSTSEAELNRLKPVDPGPMNNLQQGAGRPRDQSNHPANKLVSSVSHPGCSGEKAANFPARKLPILLPDPFQVTLGACGMFTTGRQEKSESKDSHLHCGPLFAIINPVMSTGTGWSGDRKTDRVSALAGATGSMCATFYCGCMISRQEGERS